MKLGFWKDESTSDSEVFLVNIRDYTKRKDGSIVAVEKGRGIALTIEVWKKFMEEIEFIKNDVEEMIFKHSPT